MNQVKKRTLTSFFKEDKPVWACYDATRKLPVFIDGLKNSQRKLLWVAFEKLTKDYIKTETYCNIVSLETAYIHGSGNLCTVCDSMVQDFVGACNYPYFVGNDGGWGSRLLTQSSAPRYTKLKLAELSKKLFHPIDNKIYVRQWFEGQWIEPKFLIPIFPTLFLNCSNGLTAGFSENIYSRNPKDIIAYIQKKLSGIANPRVELAPWFKGYKGTIVFNKDTGEYESVGHIEQNNKTSYTITEIPVETSYQKYIEFLDKLEDDGTIQGYEDKCDPRTNEMLFEIKTTREFSRKHSTLDSLNRVFKLVRSLPEQYNCIDGDGKVREFSSAKEILDAFIDIRLKMYQTRKDFIIAESKKELDIMLSKWLFCEGIIKKTIKVANVKKADIVKQLQSTSGIKEVDGSYDYLLRIPIYQITLEKIEELKKQIADLKTELKKVEATSINDMWLTDLAELKKVL